jgi:acetylglutamate kinase
MKSIKNKEFESLNILDLLPRISAKYNKTIIVIKYGGNAMSNNNIKQSVIRDVVLLKSVGMRPVIVHGGGPAISEHMERVDLEPVFIDGQRVTDQNALEIVEMVLCGKVNNDLVKLLNIEGVKSVGLSGKDDGLVTAKKFFKKTRNNGNLEKIDLGHVGEVVDINTRIIDLLLDNDYVPVIAPIAVGEDNEDYNINADILAGEIATALNAEKLIYLTNVNGILTDPDDVNSCINNIDILKAGSYMGKIITGGMMPKVKSAIKALENGLMNVHIIDGTMAHSLIKIFINDNLVGTTIYPITVEVKA